MAEAAFNTIAEVQRLRDAGFEQAQAEAITLSIHAGVTGGVATKADVERLEGKFTAVHKDIEVLRGEMTASVELVHKDIEVLRGEMTAMRVELDTKIDSSVEALNTKIDTSVTFLEGKIATVHKDIEVLRGEMQTATKTTIIWLGGILFVLASALGLLDRLFPPAI